LKKAKQAQSTKTQVAAFRKAARDLGADESEATFDAALGKIARHKPKPELKMRPVRRGEKKQIEP